MPDDDKRSAFLSSGNAQAVDAYVKAATPAPSTTPDRRDQFLQSGSSTAIDAYSKIARPAGYRNGGTVKKTGIALVHKGERVLNKRQAKRYRRSSSR